MDHAAHDRAPPAFAAKLSRMARRVATFALAAALALSSGPAAGQLARCASRDSLVAWLETTFREQRTAFGVSQSGTLLELFVSRSGSWTMLLSFPDGVTCIIDAGDAWQDFRPAADDAKDGPAA
jgi:hypothetical protein